jgi:hypothetical protein
LASLLRQLARQGASISAIRSGRSSGEIFELGNRGGRPSDEGLAAAVDHRV